MLSSGVRETLEEAGVFGQLSENQFITKYFDFKPKMSQVQFNHLYIMKNYVLLDPFNYMEGQFRKRKWFPYKKALKKIKKVQRKPLKLSYVSFLLHQIKKDKKREIKMKQKKKQRKAQKKLQSTWQKIDKKMLLPQEYSAKRDKKLMKLLNKTMLKPYNLI